MEISTRHHGKSVHLLGYLPDPDYPPLVAALTGILDGRNARLPAILARLVELGIEIEEAEVHALAGDPAATGRPHLADDLVESGIVVDRTPAFTKFLTPGRPASAPRTPPAPPTNIV